MGRSRLAALLCSLAAACGGSTQPPRDGGGSARDGGTAARDGGATDTRPPAWPPASELRAVRVGSFAATLSWTAATDDVGVVAYRLFQGGAAVAELPGSARSLEVAGLTPGTTYRFEVQAGDAAGNWSTDGPFADVATTSLPDALRIGATSGDLTLDYTVSIQGTGPAAIGRVDIAGNVGTVTVAGTSLSAVSFERQPWPGFGYTLFQTLIVAPDRWYVAWFYCRGGSLEHVYYEGTDGTRLDDGPASGTCVDELRTTVARVELPALEMPLPAPTTGYTVSGENVQITADGRGWVRLGGITMTALIFEHVDCSTQCGSPGWYELHSVLWDEIGGRACFGIFYLQEGQSDVLLAYSLSLPDLSDPLGEGIELPASWTTP